MYVDSRNTQTNEDIYLTENGYFWNRIWWYNRVCTHTLVDWATSRIIASKAAVSSACFWLCKAIFSLNFLGFAMMAEISTTLLWFYLRRGSTPISAAISVMWSKYFQTVLLPVAGVSGFQFNFIANIWKAKKWVYSPFYIALELKCFYMQIF